MPKARRGTAGILTQPILESCKTFRQARAVAELLRDHNVPCTPSTFAQTRRSLVAQLTDAGMDSGDIQTVVTLYERNRSIVRTNRYRVKALSTTNAAQNLRARMTEGPLPERLKVRFVTIFSGCGFAHKDNTQTRPRRGRVQPAMVRLSGMWPSLRDPCLSARNQ